MMPISATSMSACKLVFGLIVVIALGSNCSLAAPRQSFGEIKYTRCDGSTDPIGKIEISACKDQKDTCLFKVGESYTATIEFTSPEAYDTPLFWLDFNSSRIGVNACKAKGIKCPLQVGVKQQLTDVFSLEKRWPLSQAGNTARLIMSNGENPDYGQFYCVEFPAKLVR